MIRRPRSVLRPPGLGLLVAALAAGSLLAGCAGGGPRPEADPQVPSGASAEQVAALEDGDVSEEEYTAGYRRLVACVTDAGYAIDEYGRPSTVYEFGIDAGAVDSGLFDECYDREFKAIDIVWQTENPPWTEAGPVLQGCLEDAGLSTEGNEEELKQRLVDNGIDVWVCLGFPPMPE